MEGRGRLSGGGVSNMSDLLQTQTLPYSSQPLDPFFIAGSSSSFNGSCSMVSFEDVSGGKAYERSFCRTFDQEDNGDDDFHLPEKKRRLTAEQVQFLERSFDAENKLESERKIQLAKDLGLQPRQVAIWFQNRRAWWKTKQLGKEFDKLQASYNSMKDDYENLLKEKEKLKAEVLRLTDKLFLKEKESKLEPTHTNNQLETLSQARIVDSASEVEEAQQSSINALKQEDLSSTKSNVFDSDSPCYINRSSYVFEPDQSDLSQDEEELFLLPSAYIFPKIEDADCLDPPTNSYNFAFQAEDLTSWFWSC
ncbi:hypothetical protein Nepgr_023795 [Nepenthes gracilis]|uniref:Homeobox-leucine zipper protein n=1 Tax=Nepenthes gracilis TaxID=150966 RepID=A0AAD3T368_NEPGR|nr:hypothetical protein Nepgr_023795 [Nepenthes gracilis]